MLWKQHVPTGSISFEIRIASNPIRTHDNLDHRSVAFCVHSVAYKLSDVVQNKKHGVCLSVRLSVSGLAITYIYSENIIDTDSTKRTFFPRG